MYLSWGLSDIHQSHQIHLVCLPNVLLTSSFAIHGQSKDKIPHSKTTPNHLKQPVLQSDKPTNNIKQPKTPLKSRRFWVLLEQN